MVSDDDRRRARYVGGAEGAPPLPPPGGYQGARRQQAPLLTPPVLPAADAVDERPSANALGWIALVVSVLFALLLLGTFAAGGTDLLYGVTMITAQLVVIGVIIAALFSPRGRRLGVIALIIAVLLNVATVGAMSALQTSAAGTYDGAKSDAQKHAEAYPGIKGTDPQQALSQQSLEEVRADAESLFADIRERLTAEFGFTWVPVICDRSATATAASPCSTSTPLRRGRPSSRCRTTPASSTSWRPSTTWFSRTGSGTCTRSTIRATPASTRP
jgi:hypothetical protein